MQKERDTRTTKIVSIAKGIRRFNEKDKHAYREWKARVSVHLNMPVPETYYLLGGKKQPNPAIGGNLVNVHRINGNPCFIFVLMTPEGDTVVVTASRRQEVGRQTWRHTRGTEGAQGEVRRLQQCHSTGTPRETGQHQHETEPGSRRLPALCIP